MTQISLATHIIDLNITRRSFQQEGTDGPVSLTLEIGQLSQWIPFTEDHYMAIGLVQFYKMIC